MQLTSKILLKTARVRRGAIRFSLSLLLGWGMLIYGGMIHPAWGRAQTLQIKDTAPLSYEVQQGDSLWRIAARFLDDPLLWPQLWQANPHLIDPYVLYPGDIIELQSRESRLHLRPRLRLLTLQDPIPFLPLNQLQAFFNGDLMIDRPEFEDALYVVGFGDARSLGSAGDRIHTLGEVTSDAEFYTVYRYLEVLRDPETRRSLGFKARAIGQARMITPGDRSTLELLATDQEIRIGDRLLPAQRSPFMDGLQPHTPPLPVHGKVMRALNPDIGRIGTFEPIILTGGAGHLQPGQLVEVLAPGRRLRDPRTGEVIFAAETVRGTVMIYRVFEQVSFGLVMQAKEPIQPGDDFRQASRPFFTR